MHLSLDPSGFFSPNIKIYIVYKWQLKDWDQPLKTDQIKAISVKKNKK